MKRKSLTLRPADETDLADKGWTCDRGPASLDPLRAYLAEIRRYPLLSREEEHRLAVEYKELAKIKAAYKLVTSNLRLAVVIALKYDREFRNLLDLIQEGNVGLMVALRKFDPYRGVRFPSYAVWWIRAYIIRYMMNNWRMVKLGTTQAQRQLFFNLEREKRRLEAEGFAPEPKLVAERLDLREREVVEMDQRLSSSDLSTDAPMGEAEGVTLLQFLPDGRQTPEEDLANTQYRHVLKERMEQFANDLRDKELVIFRERLLTDEPLTLREIGERYSITRERVRQIEQRVKKKLRAYLYEDFKDLKEAGQGWLSITDAISAGRASQTRLGTSI